MNKNIIFAGIGGQGVITISEVVGILMMNKGYDVKIADIHGMAQRGGSVCSELRVGTHINSPITTKGEVDIIIGLEIFETLRWMDYLKDTGKAICLNFKKNINDQYDFEEIINKNYYRDKDSRLFLVDNIKDEGANMFFLGIMLNYFDISFEECIALILNKYEKLFNDKNIALIKSGLKYRINGLR